MKEPNRVAVFVIFMGMHVHLISLQVVQDVADVLLIAQVTQVIVTLLTAISVHPLGLAVTKATLLGTLVVTKPAIILRGA